METDIDVLKELSFDELVQMQAICKKYLPKSIRAHHYLHNYIIWEKQYPSAQDQEKIIISDKCRIKFYGHRSGDIANCTFLGISGVEDYGIFCYSLQESGEELRECLGLTKRISWDLNPLIISLEIQHLKELHRVFSLDCFFYIPNYIFYFPKEKASSLEVTVPDDCYIAPLKEEDVKQIDDAWPHQYARSYIYIKTCVITNGGIGLYSKVDKKLLSWIILNDNFCPGFLQTAIEARRKGYASLVTKVLVRLIAEKYGLDTLIFVVKVNQSSVRLYKKLGFEIINTCAWLKIDRAIKF